MSLYSVSSIPALGPVTNHTVTSLSFPEREGGLVYLHNVIWRKIIIMEIMVIIIIIIINCNWVVTQWQWLFYMYTKYGIGY